MKGIILAAGKAKRLYPLTKVAPKCLLPVYDRPMISFALEFMKMSGVKDVAIVVSEENENLYRSSLGDGGEYGLNLSYIVQREINGTAGAVKLARDFIGGEDVVLYYGDNIIFNCNLEELSSNGIKNVANGCASIFALEVANPTDYGVLEIASDGHIVSLEEKPLEPKSNFIAPGIYFYPNDLVDRLEIVEKSPRGEYEMTDVNISYLKDNKLSAVKLPREAIWFDAGTFDELLDAAVSVKNMM